MFADLHLHSYFSDGTLSPREIAQEAVRHGIGLISITDHNTRTAYPETQAACREAGVRLIPGVEIDAMTGNCGYPWCSRKGSRAEQAKKIQKIDYWR